MLEVVAEETIDCTPDEFLEFVLDVHRYAQIDHKIKSIDWAKRDGDLTDFKFRPALPGVPGPAPKMVMRVERTSPTRLDMSLSPPPHNRLIRPLMSFASSFECTPVDGGIRLRSVTTFGIHPAARWLMEPILRRKLPPDIEAELKRAKALLEKQNQRHGGPEST